MLGLLCGLIAFRHLPTEGVTLCDFGFGGLYALDATSALATFGMDLAHFFDWVINTAVIAVSGFRHGDD